VTFAILLFLAVATASAQQSKATYTYDVNGNRVEGVRLQSGKSERKVLVKSPNGGTVPEVTSEEKVISDSGGRRVVERLVRRYDPDGKPIAPEKILIEEQKNPDGSSNVLTTIQRGDVNGRYEFVERSRSESRKSGDTTTTSTAVERPTLNGSFDVIEKRDETRRETKAGDVTQNSTVYRPDTNGRFQEAERQSFEKKVTGGQSLENDASYLVQNNGRLELVRQKVTRSMKAADGSEHKEVDVFEPAFAGRVTSETDTQPKLREQQVIERRPSASGSVESLSVRRPLPSDPSKLGNLQKVGETICTGECK
jgi:hypothetical protein